MEEQTIKINENDIKQLVKDVAVIKSILMNGSHDSEGELSDWAKDELKRAREEHEEEYTDLHEL